MYTLKNATIKLNDKGRVTVLGDIVPIPIRVITFMDKGFSFNIQAGNKQHYVPFANINTKKSMAPVDLVIKTGMENVECPALFLYDLLAEYTCYKKKVFVDREYSLESIKARHKACANLYENVDLEALLGELKFCQDKG